MGCLRKGNIPAVIVVVNNDGYTIERAIHGRDAYYNDIVAWKWLDIPKALGVGRHRALRAQTYGQLADAFSVAAAPSDEARS